MQDKHKETAKPDFIAAVVLTLLSLSILGISLAMPEYARQGAHAAPSLSPTIFSLLMLFCSLILLVRSVRFRGYGIRVSREMFLQFIRSRPVHNFVAAFSLVLIYAFLLGKLHFALVSALYLFANILYFRSTGLLKNLIISVLSSVSIWYCFDSLFLIPLL